jgi:Cthe_2314-like HEPN
MNISIELFDFPTKEDMLPLLNESPLSDYLVEQKSFFRKDLSPIEQLDYQMQLNEMVSYLNNRLYQVNLSYAYILYYFNRSIPDEEWKVLNGEGKMQYFPHLKNEHWTNKIHFEHHTDSLFQRAFTTLDLFAHILYQRFDLVREVRNGKQEDISFNRAIWKLKKQDVEIFNKLILFKNAEKFKVASKIRNNIIHNQPPYRVHTLSETHKGVTSMKTYYMTSKRLKENMLGLLENMKNIFETVRIHCEELE